MNIANDCYQINFEKSGNNIWNERYGQPDNVMTYLRTNDIKTVYIVGNNVNSSVQLTCEGLLKSKYNVVVVADATHEINMIDGKALEDLGVRYITTDEAIGELSE